MSDISISFRGSASRDQRDQALLWLLEGKSALPVVQLQDPLQFLIRMLVTVSTWLKNGNVPSFCKISTATLLYKFAPTILND